GCSLVDLDSDGVIRCRFLPTAPVRWENFDIEIDADTTFQQLVTRAQAACRHLCGVEPKLEQGSLVAEYGDASEDDTETDATVNEPAAVSEALHAQACFLRWTIRGDGPLFDGLFKDEMQTELIEWLDDDVHWCREWSRTTNNSMFRPNSSGGSIKLSHSASRPGMTSAEIHRSSESASHRFKRPAPRGTRPSSSASLAAVVGNGFEGQTCSSVAPQPRFGWWMYSMVGDIAGKSECESWNDSPTKTRVAQG
ncbi:MAG: hypothetical protein FD138_4455, partial [Planctomycetota bacterium]